MKKIAILTYHRHDNYGAVLQCYALQQVLLRMGVEAEVLDYICKQSLHPLSCAAIQSRGIIACFKSFIGKLLRLPRANAFRRFRNKLSMSQSYSMQTISAAANRYDCFIVGSDNVWNTEITGFDKTYFLDFVQDNAKKSSYAASMGNDYAPKRIEPEIARLLGSFRSLCVREKSTSQYLRLLLEREIDSVLDPTMLLPADEWIRVAVMPRITDAYILAYQMVPSRSFVSFAKAQAKRFGCKLVFVPFAQGGFSIRSRHMCSIGPAEWIGLVNNAKYIITDSFHGCVFSILFHKKFAVRISQLGCRVDNLLSLFGLKDRIVGSNTEFDLDAPIDYDDVEKQLVLQRTHANQALYSILNGV